MGERALIQLIDKERNCSPTLYLHWGGGEVGSILSRLQKRMDGRRNDIEYGFARLVQEAINGDDGNLSFGVSNQSTIISDAYSPGDAGAFVVDVSTTPWTVWCGGDSGYGFDDAGGGNDEYAGEFTINTDWRTVPTECSMAIAEGVSTAILDALDNKALRFARDEANESMAHQAASMMQLLADGLELLADEDDFSDDKTVMCSVLSDACRKGVANLTA